MRKVLILVIALVLAICIIDTTFSKGIRERGGTMFFTIKPLRGIYLLGEKMLAEISFKNNSKYPIKFSKNFPANEKLFFRLRLSEESIHIEKMKEKHNRVISRRAKVDPNNIPAEWVILKPTEEYKTNIDISELVGELGLKPGIYNIQLVYTMWILMLKDWPEYAKDKKGKTREWESNKIEIKIGNKGLQDFLKVHPKADLNKDGILTEKEKSQFSEKIRKRK